jgi:hypothetical protein
MKKLLLLCLYSIPLLGQSQDLTVSGTSVSMNPAGRIITPAASANCRIWVEPGDGKLRTDNFGTYAYSSPNITHKPLLFRTFLYDTSRTRVSSVSGMGGLSIVPSLNMQTSWSNQNDIILAANVPDIISRDTMAFRIQYNLVDFSQYAVVLFYNSSNDGVFVPLSSNIDMNAGGELFKAVRVHRNESIAFNNTMGVNPGAVYGNSIAFSLPRDTGSNALFVSLVTAKNLTVGNNSTLMAALVRSSGQAVKGGPPSLTLVKTASLSGMQVAVSHDPNNILVKPACINLPVAAHDFDYTINFENLGEGPAEKVLIRAHLPKGMDWSTLQIGEVNFAGEIYAAGSTKVKVTSTPFAAGDSLEILIEGLAGTMLTGVDKNNPFNPACMGHVKLKIKSTATTAEELNANAMIYFKSLTPAGRLALINGIPYQEGIETNKAVTKYMKDCSGVIVDPASCNCKNPVGIMCWITCYWWAILIILLLLLILIWRLRKKQP